MERKITGEITLSSNDEHARLPTIPQPVLEALFKSVTSAREKFNTRRRKAKSISIDDLRQLQYHIQQWAEPLNPIGNSLAVVVTRESNDGIGGADKSTYTDFESVARHEPSRNDPISNLTVKFDFLVAGGDQKKADSFQCEITLFGETHIYWFMDKKDGFLGSVSMRELDDNDTSMRVEVRYSNYMVAKGLMHVIDEWYSSVNEQTGYTVGRFFRWMVSLTHYTHDQSNLLVSGLLGLLTLTLASGTHSYMVGLTGFEPVHSALFSVGIYYAVLCLAVNLLTIELKKLDPPGRVPLMEINRGDSLRIKKYQEGIAAFKKRESSIASFVVYGVSASLVASLLLNAWQIFLHK